jgi:hypothetical protein
LSRYRRGVEEGDEMFDEMSARRQGESSAERPGVELATMIRTQIAINDVSFFLAQGQSIADFKQRVEAAAQSGGRFVDFTVVGNRQVSVLISSASHVVVSVETVQFDPRDTGDEAEPFGGTFDLL